MDYEFHTFFWLHLKKCEQSKDSLMKSLKCMNREYKKIKNKKIQIWVRKRDLKSIYPNLISSHEGLGRLAQRLWWLTNLVSCRINVIYIYIYIYIFEMNVGLYYSLPQWYFYSFFFNINFICVFAKCISLVFFFLESQIIGISFLSR